MPVEGGFAIPLPYGDEVDWLRNVLAAGEATVVLDGVRHRVTQPVVVPSDADPLVVPSHGDPPPVPSEKPPKDCP